MATAGLLIGSRLHYSEPEQRVPNTADINNRVLAALPEPEWQRIREGFEPASYPQASRLYEPGDTFDKVYFPTDGVISSVTTMSNGATIEGLLTGREGLVGGVSAVQPAICPWLVITQSRLECVVIDALSLRVALPDMPALQRLLLLHTQAMSFMATQSTACNHFHELASRAARWLLTVGDRLDREEIDLTQEFLANMLGAQRPSVTVALGTLERAGLVVLRRGSITIARRTALEDVACECYGRVEAEIERVFLVE